MPKIFKIKENNDVVGYAVYCPGCENYHSVYVKPHKNSYGASWSFSGDFDKPSFTPSLFVRGEHLCHSHITAGNIQYLPDSTHKLSGQTVSIINEQ